MNLNKRIEDAFSHLVEKSGVSAGQVVGLLKDIGTLNGGAVVPSRVEGDDAYFVSRIGHALNRQAIYYCNALTNNTSATFLGDKYRKDLLSDGESSEDGSTPASAFVHVEDRRIRALRNKPTGLTYFRQYLKNGESLAPEMHPDVVMSELLATRARLASHVAGDIVPGRYTTRFMLENFKRLADGSAAGRARMAVRARDRVSVLYNATYFDQLLESIDGAAQEISVLMFFFPYDGRRTRAVTTKVFRALVNAHGRGVKVTVVLDRGPEGRQVFHPQGQCKHHSGAQAGGYRCQV